MPSEALCAACAPNAFRHPVVLCFPPFLARTAVSKFQSHLSAAETKCAGVEGGNGKQKAVVSPDSKKGMSGVLQC